MNTYLKSILATPEKLDDEIVDKLYGDLLVDAKNLKVKIAEYVNKEPEVEKIDEYSRSPVSQSERFSRSETRGRKLLRKTRRNKQTL